MTLFILFKHNEYVLISFFPRPGMLRTGVLDSASGAFYYAHGVEVGEKNEIDEILRGGNTVKVISTNRIGPRTYMYRKEEKVLRE